MASRVYLLMFVLTTFNSSFANIHGQIHSEKLSKNGNNLPTEDLPRIDVAKWLSSLKFNKFPPNIQKQQSDFHTHAVSDGTNQPWHGNADEMSNTKPMVPELGINIQHRSHTLFVKNEVAISNLIPTENKSKQLNEPIKSVSDSVKTMFVPGMPASNFSVPTLNGKLVYPGTVINHKSPIIFHSYNPNSGFLNCLWNCSGTLDDFVKASPDDVHYIFVSNSPSAYADAQWMRHKLVDTLEKVKRLSLLKQLHFVTLPLNELGNWIPQLLWQWSCPDHNCGLDQVRLQSPQIQEKLKSPLVLPRLDARYDWLPSPGSKLGDKTLDAVLLTEPSRGCNGTAQEVKGVVAMVPEGGCSYFKKVQSLQKAGAAAVLVLQTESSVLQDMNCVQSECGTPLSIPAAMMPSHPLLTGQTNLTVQFQNTPSENFFFGIDHQGSLSEFGWVLFPSFRFLSWQAQWFSYKRGLSKRLDSETDVMLISVFNHTVMQGAKGAVSTVTLPDILTLGRFQNVELDASLSCPGQLDQSCPHWDQTVQLYVCCNLTSPLCGMELGRWISPFRRRIGRWLTPVRSLLPLFTSDKCELTMKTVPWAMPWKPSLTLRFSNRTRGSDSSLYPFHTQPLYHPSFTFDKHYNSHFNKTTFDLPAGTRKVELVSVITGHGSDENGCGEFCVTSHHFVVNGYTYNRTFDIAGSPFGCADGVLDGVEPNEHGTWLYGRDGWCDGQQVTPWVIDLTAKVKVTGTNTLTYFGWFNGTDPNPRENPGIMIFYSYLTYYKEIAG